MLTFFTHFFPIFPFRFKLSLRDTWQVSKYGAFSDPYFPVFSPNTGKYGPEKTPYLDTFHTLFVFYLFKKEGDNVRAVLTRKLLWHHCIDIILGLEPYFFMHSCYLKKLWHYLTDVSSYIIQNVLCLKHCNKENALWYIWKAQFNRSMSSWFIMLQQGFSIAFLFFVNTFLFNLISLLPSSKRGEILANEGFSKWVVIQVLGVLIPGKYASSSHSSNALPFTPGAHSSKFQGDRIQMHESGHTIMQQLVIWPTSCSW